MAETPRVSLERLRQRLRELGLADALILHRLDRALAARNADLVAAAMNGLAAYPPAVREAIEDVIVHWLQERMAMLERRAAG